MESVSESDISSVKLVDNDALATKVAVPETDPADSVVERLPDRETDALLDVETETDELLDCVISIVDD
ncbi:MAG: hypothetical protein Q8J97_04885 [Flavobacteriaceae bacterium]|nr:hypothetical protein [Flavobacteriaceae bacterium]